MADGTSPSAGFDISSFLAEGAPIPSGSALKASVSQTVLPDWYTNYAMNILANQQAASSQPFSAFPGPRVAEFSPAQVQSFDMTKQAAGAYQPGLTAATDATQRLLGANALGLAQPFFGQAAGMSGVQAARPGLEQATGFATAATAPTGMQAAAPYLTQAGQSTVANINQYMNPYQEQVVNRIGELAGRNLRENIMPEVEGRYIRAGQLGFGPRGPGAGTPSGMLTDTARAIRDTQEATLAAQSQALQQGFGAAAGLSAADLSRQSQLAQTAGQLGVSQQGALATAAQNLADIGKTYGGLTADQQRLLTDIGTQTGSLGGADITRQLEAARQMGALAEAAQTLGLRGAEAVGGVGALQQAQAQKNLDLAREDFLREQGYPQEQINNMLKTLGGLAGAVPTATTEAGLVPTGQQDQYKPSTAATIAGGLAGTAALVKSLKDIF